MSASACTRCMPGYCCVRKHGAVLNWCSLQSGGAVTLKVSGYIRGQALSANCLVHMPGSGDFQLLQIDATTEPYPDARPKILNTGKRSIAPMVTSVCGTLRASIVILPL